VVKTSSVILGLGWLVLAHPLSADPSSEADRFWGQWRGPRATGVAPLADPPVEWSDDKNIRWKVELPGEGQSTPIVWGDLVYIQAAIPEKVAVASGEEPKTEDGRRGGGQASGDANDAEGGERERRDGEGRPDRRGGRGRRTEAPAETYQFTIMAFDRKTGKQTWVHTVRKEVPHEGSHQDGSLAPASPLTDGSRLFAFFGSRGLYAFDMQGKLLWERDFGDMKTRAGFGEGSSPVLYKDTLVVNWDHEGDSFIVALDKNTGQERWRKNRSEVTTWATPLILEANGKVQIVVPASKRVRGYDLANGNVLWECGGLGANCVPSPVAGLGLVFAMSGHRDPALLAIRYEGASGDITGSEAVAWRIDKGTPYVPSPLLYGDALYLLQKNTGILSCYHPQTGTPHYEQQRLEEIDGVYASPIGARNRVYITGRNGATHVLKRGPKFEILAINKLKDDFSASPAAAGKEFYLRGRKNLYCIAAE